MSFNLIEYYKALNGESSLSNSTWHINYDKRHAFKVHSSVDGYNPSAGGMYLPPTDETTEDVVTFSDKSGQKINNTKIVTDANGVETVELELADRVVAIVIDQSGSMTWNDTGQFRHDIAQDLVNKIDFNYPGNISYDLIDYGAKFINVLLFGIIDEGDVNPYDINSLAAMFQADENANYDGIRVVRSTEGYPTSPIDEIVQDGFVNRILDDELVDGQTYYYTVYTYDDLGRFSDGVNIKVTPRDRIIPRGVSVFRTAVEIQDLSLGEPFTGSGVNRDDNTIGIWHMDEGEGRYAYDFSDTGAILTHSNETPTWYDSRFVTAGTSGLFLNGITDSLTAEDTNGDFEMTWEANNNTITICAWVYPYENIDPGFILSRGYSTKNNYMLIIDANNTLIFDDGTSSFIQGTIALENYKWQHIAVTYNGSTCTYYINGVPESFSVSFATYSNSNTHDINIGNSIQSGNNIFKGKITEVSVHNTVRSSDYINAQIIDSPILDDDGVEVDTEKIGIKDDNGDRLVVLDYEIPEDYNFSGGEVIIVKNEEHIPSWEEDGTILHQESPVVGKTFVSDSDDFALGEKYYYRIFSKNSLGNVSFQSDSPSLEVTIPVSSIDDYFVALSSPIANPNEPNEGVLVTPGNGKVYLRWVQDYDGNGDLTDSRISRVKIYYRDDSLPTMNSDGGTDGTLVFIGLPTDEKFVHRNLVNGTSAYYTIINVDKYGRPSGYNADGSRYEDLLQISTTPTSTASEETIPLLDVSNLNYEIRDDNAITIGWDQPVKSPENIDAYFDQTVLVYASITDEFGDVLPEYASIKMYISSNIVRRTQADDVFDSIAISEFDDIDAYDFFVTRTDQGFLKATLRMSNNSRIISQIEEATFTIQLKSFIPKEGGYVPANTGSTETGPLAEYADLLEDLISDIDGEETETVSSDNVFEYLSKSFTVHYTNPWELTLESKYDNQRVYERCYYPKVDKITEEKSLGIDIEMFYGVPMRASFPFVARVKVKYKGEPVDNTSIQIAVWDADSSNLCAGAGGDSPWGIIGDDLQSSSTVLPPDSNMFVLQGTEFIPGPDGTLIDSPISYVDIPLQAPQSAQAVRLYVKGEKTGYVSINNMAILFQSLLRTELSARTPVTDGADVAEQTVHAYIIHPDYPDQNDAFAESLRTNVTDLTIVQWDLDLISGENVRSIYSTDNVPVSNGVYSYTRNGYARNVFLGPIAPASGSAYEETHRISATIVYEGMTSNAQSYIVLEDDVTDSTVFGARFLMEVDGSWKSDGTYASGHWDDADNAGNTLWADGSHYKKMKVNRNPAGELTFNASVAFNSCASQDDSQVFELNSGQIVEILTGDDNIEILHGDITEEYDPYTGRYNLVVEEDGFIDNGSAFIELVNEDISDVTYFYIRANKFIPGSGGIIHNFLIDEEPINECLLLNPSKGLFKEDLPEWEPYFTVSGKTTLFVNDQPLVLRGGGNFYTGIPPCPICLNEPLLMYVIWKQVTNYFYSESLGDPSNDFLYAATTESENNSFTDSNGDTLINNLSDVDIRVQVSWRGEALPEDTPVYTSIGDNTSRTLFLASSNPYYTQVDETDGNSYVDVRLSARRIPTATTTELVEIYALYDENGKTDRHVGANFNLTIDVKNVVSEIPTLPEPDPSAVPVVPPPNPYTGIMHKYDINTDEWSTVAPMDDSRGNFFMGEVGGKIYVMGGLMNNSLNISSKTEEYDIDTDLWIDQTIMPTPRFGGMSVTIGNDIYTIGGIFQDDSMGGGLSVSSAVEVYHALNDTWESLEDMPTLSELGTSEDRLCVAFGAAQHVVVENNNYIYVLGGVSDINVSTEHFALSAYSRRILRYHVENDTWEYSDILRSNELNTYQRIYPLTLEYDGKIIAFNGAIESGNNFIYPTDDFYVNIEDIFANTESGNEWISFGSGLLNGFPVAKFQSAMVQYSDNPSIDIPSSYYILGGSNDDTSSLDVLENLSATSNGFSYISSYDSSVSMALTPLTIGRHGASAVYSDASGSPSIYLLGGYTIAQESNFVDIEFDI